MLTKATRMKKVTAALLALVLALTCLGALNMERCIYEESTRMYARITVRQR